MFTHQNMAVMGLWPGHTTVLSVWSLGVLDTSWDDDNVDIEPNYPGYASYSFRVKPRELPRRRNNEEEDDPVRIGISFRRKIWQREYPTGRLAKPKITVRFKDAPVLPSFDFNVSVAAEINTPSVNFVVKLKDD